MITRHSQHPTLLARYAEKRFIAWIAAPGNLLAALGLLLVALMLAAMVITDDHADDRVSATGKLALSQFWTIHDAALIDLDGNAGDQVLWPDADGNTDPGVGANGEGDSLPAEAVLPATRCCFLPWAPQIRKIGAGIPVGEITDR